jgi:hypothetical protein
MRIWLLVFRFFFTTTALTLIAACGGVGGPTDAGALAPQQRTAAQRGSDAMSTVSPEKCAHSRGLRVVPCHLTFTKGRGRSRLVDVTPGEGSGSIGEFDDCAGIAIIDDFSGPIYAVNAKRTRGTCMAIFTEGNKSATLTIDDNL